MNDAALDILLRHDRWATNALLDACASLNDIQLDAPHEIDFGTLRNTLTHLIDVIGFWTGGERADRLLQTTSIAELKPLFAAKYDAFKKLIAATPDNARWQAETPTRFTNAPAVSIACHVVTHSMHYRAQALNFLCRLGVERPPAGIYEWAALVGVSTVTLKK